MSGASALFILDSRGKVIISRKYRNDIPLNVADNFCQCVIQQEDAMVKPVFSVDGVVYCWIQHRDVYVLAVTLRNSNAMMIVTFLYRLVDVLKSYFKVLEEESLRDNFVVTYELLDEVMDAGFPQTTEGRILRQYIKNEAHQLLPREPGRTKLPTCVTNAVSWRADGIKYKKNEIFLDVVEKLNLLVSSNGTVLRSEIVGSLKMRSCLSGMPELKLGLNDKLQFEASRRDRSNAASGGGGALVTAQGRFQKSVELEDVRFHQCVRLSRFESDRTISFIPPDGEFELMSYRLGTQVKPLIWIECSMTEPENSRTRFEYVVKAKSNFRARSVANDVEIHIPVPTDADTPTFKAALGHVKYIPDQNIMVWHIKQFSGQKELVMSASFGFPTITNDLRSAIKRPISVVFEIPYFTVSSMTVRYLKIVEKSGYQALPWVRYITRNGDYQLRMN